PAWAQSSNGAAPYGGWSLGVGAVSSQQPYIGADSKTRVLPLVYFDSRWVRLAGTTADLKLLNHAFTPTQQVAAGLRLRYSGEGYEASDSPALAGMAERKDGFWGGVGATWRNPVAQVSAEWLTDLSGHSKGQKIQLQVDRRFGWNSFGLTPRVQAQWLDKDHVTYYYGVRAEEALPTRAAYAAKSAMTMEAGLRLDYSLATHHTMFLDLSATRLPDEIRDSPIVDRKTMSRVAVGYIYRF
ncbi:MAG: MipA/OmpV family protein, partial [Burkholderiaceae bacterium]